MRFRVAIANVPAFWIIIKNSFFFEVAKLSCNRFKFWGQIIRNIISSRHTFLTDILDTFEKDVFLPCNDGLIFYPFLMLAHLPEAAVSS